MSELPLATAGSVRVVRPAGRAWSRLALYLELAKARLCTLVLVTTLVGFILADGANVEWGRLGWTLVGTALAAFGANALNQCLEVDRDGRMQRTRGRPLPSGQLSRTAAWAFALATGAAGPSLLWASVNALSATLAIACLLIYVFCYTPLKPRTPLNTLVGALVGAIPPMIGWTAASGRSEPGAWVLAGILFFWQIPHFLALAWLYRDDYARGGFRMLPVLDATGHTTGCVIVVYSLMLVPLGLATTLTGVTGTLSAAGSLLLGAGLVGLALRLYRQRTNANARRVFIASIVYLPLLLGLMVIDRAPARQPEPPVTRHASTGPTVAELAETPPQRPAFTRARP